MSENHQFTGSEECNKKNRKSHKAPSVKDVLRNGIFSKQKTDSKCFRKDFCLKQGFSAYHFAAWWLIQPAKVFEFLKNAATCRALSSQLCGGRCLWPKRCGNVLLLCSLSVCQSTSDLVATSTPITELRIGHRSAHFSMVACGADHHHHQLTHHPG